MGRLTVSALLTATASIIPFTAASAQTDSATANTVQTDQSQSTTPGAQAPTQQAAAETPAEGVEEILVQAQRRTENMQDVPIAISAVSGDTAAQLGVTNPENITQVMPGVTFTRQAQGGVPFIRGIGTTSSFVGNEPSVALFVDDVYIVSGTAAIFDFNMIDSIEVLKGPQGTLFGRNATGGVIHVHTRRPSFHPTLDASIGYGNYDTLTGQLYASTGLTDTLAVSIAGFFNDQNDGWGHDFSAIRQQFLKSTPVAVTPGQREANYSTSWGVRGRALWQPNDRASVLLTGMYNERDSDQGYAQRVISGLLGRNGYNPDAPGLGIGIANTPNGIGFYDTTENIGTGYHVRYQNYSARAEYDFGAATFVSISALAYLKVQPSLDLDAAPANFLNSYNHYGADTFTQEFQLLSPDSSAVRWILGAYYLHDESYFQGRYSGPAVTGAAPAGEKYQIGDGYMTTNSWSGFGQATFEMLPRTNLTLGLRYTSDNRSTDPPTGGGYRRFDESLILQTGPFSDSVTFGALTGRASIDYHFNDDIMAYIAYNRGFKSGVYNLAGYSPAVTTVLPPVRPEEINAYTIGFKSDLFDRLVRFNVEGYYYDYKNIQVQNNRSDGCGTIFINGGAARIMGIDADLTVAPARGLRITAAVNIQDGEYTDFRNGPTFFLTGPNTPPVGQRIIPSFCSNLTLYPGTNAAGAVTSTSPLTQILAPLVNGVPQAGAPTCDLTGNDTVLTPPFTLSLSATYNVPTSFGPFDFAVSWLHTGNYFFEPDNLSFTRQPTYDLVNASIRWTSNNEAIGVRLWANNIFDEQYYSYIANSATSGTKGAPAAPRTYGVTLLTHF